MAGAIFITASNICSALYPRLFGQVVDTIVHKQATIEIVINTILLILLLTIGSGAFMFATRKTVIVSSRRIEYELRRDFLSALERQAQSFYDRMPTGILMAYATNDIAAVREFLGPALMYSANTLTTFTFVITLMMRIDPVVTIVALAPLPLIAWSTYAIGRKIYNFSHRVQEEYSSLTRHVQEAFSGIRIVRGFVSEKYQQDLFRQKSERYAFANLRLARLQALFMPSMMILVGISQVLVLLIGGYKVTVNTLSVGQLTQFFIYLGQLIWPIAAIGWVTGIVQRAAASLDRLSSILDTSGPTKRYTQALQPSLNPKKYTVELHNVSFGYSPGYAVLKSISCWMDEGEHIGIVGPIGSGKSTLLKLLVRLYQTHEGSIYIGGIPLESFSQEQLCTIITVVPQEPFLFSISIAENIRVGKPTATDAEVREAAIAAGIASEIEALPNQYDTIVGERGVLLSGGQRQRLAIARALVARPRILLLDDALSAVDTATERSIISHLQKLPSTTIIVTHRLSSIEHCQRIFVIEHGMLTAQGSHEELIDRNSFYRTLYMRQQLEMQLHIASPLPTNDGILYVNS